MSRFDLQPLRTVLAGREAPARVASRPAGGGRPAAVLIALADIDGDTEVVLVEKNARLRSHSGQMAFPGGAMEPSDASPIAAALREAEEEVGLRPDEVEVLGVLPAAYVRASDFDVTSVVARWTSPRALMPVDVGEIAAVHSVAIDVLLEPANRVTWQLPNGFAGPGFVAGELFVWGFTAYLLDGMFELAGWTLPWDASRVSDVPERFFRGRGR